MYPLLSSSTHMTTFRYLEKTDMTKGLRVLELFSGIGGMHQALELLHGVEVRADN